MKGQAAGSYVKFALPLGMVSSTVYIAHTLLGRFLRSDYNPITEDISSLTASGAPYSELLRVFTAVYGICFVLFAAALFIETLKSKNKVLLCGFAFFALSAVISVVGYGLFPLSGDKTQMTFGNVMHIAVTIAVVFSSIAALYLIAFGYKRRKETRVLGNICLGAAVLFTLAGLTNPVGLANGWNILGLTERLVIYTLQAFVFFLSFVMSFRTDLYVRRD